jgi:repressor LexA
VTNPAEQPGDDALALPEALVGHGTLFALTVRDDAMIDEAICDGDIVVVRRQHSADSGDIVAAMVDGEVTVRVYRVRDGRAALVPRNPAYDAIPGESADLLGKVVSVVRRI